MLLFLQRALERIIEVCRERRDSLSQGQLGSIICGVRDVQSFSNQKYKIFAFSMLTRPGFTECEASLFCPAQQNISIQATETEEEVKEGEKDG